MTAPVIAPSEAIPAASSHFRPSKRPHSWANSGILFSGDNLSENAKIKRWSYDLWSAVGDSISIGCLSVFVISAVKFVPSCLLCLPSKFPERLRSSTYSGRYSNWKITERKNKLYKTRELPGNPLVNISNE